MIGPSAPGPLGVERCEQTNGESAARRLPFPDRPALGAYRTPWHQARAAEAGAAARARAETLRREAELRAELGPSEVDPEVEAAFEALIESREPQANPANASTPGSSNVCSPTMARVERRYELDHLWRSIAMLTPNARAVMSREEALELLSELGELHQRIDVLRAELRRLADDL